MKLIAVTSIREYEETVATLFSNAGISIYSVYETTGHKKGQPFNMPDNWFGKVGDTFNSLLFFSFTTVEQAQKLISLVNEYNEQMQSSFPVHAFVIAVEHSSI